jgi:hypothetical protein
LGAGVSFFAGIWHGAAHCKLIARIHNHTVTPFNP